MIASCKTRVTQALVAAGVPAANVFIRESDLGQHRLVPSAVLVAGGDLFEKDGTLTARWVNEETRRVIHRRRQKRRRLQIAVMLFAATQEAADAILEAALIELGPAFVEPGSGNPIRVERVVPTWLDEKSIQRAESRCTAGLEFHGGVYKDAAKLLHTAVRSVPAGLL